MWNLEEKKLVATLKEHDNWVLGICFSADGKLLATGSADKSWRVWEAGTWKPLFYKWMQDDAVRRCAFSPPRGDLVAVAVAGRSDRAVRIRYKEANSAQQIKVLDTGPGMPQDLLWLAQGNKLYVACSDKAVRVFDAGKWELAATLRGHGDWVYAVAATADGTKLASGSGDGTVKLWNTADNSLLATLVQLAPRTDDWLIVTGQGYFATSTPGAVQWKTTNLPATPEKLSGLRNPEMVQQFLAGKKTPPPTLQ